MNFVNRPNVPYGLLIPSNTKIANDYTFDASNGTVEVRDIDFIRAIAITNLNNGVLLFNPSMIGTRAQRSNGLINLSVDTTGMNDADQLLILYEYAGDDIASVLCLIRDELEKQTRILEKIKA